jgi:hypothetical protein
MSEYGYCGFASREAFNHALDEHITGHWGEDSIDHYDEDQKEDYCDEEEIFRAEEKYREMKQYE